MLTGGELGRAIEEARIKKGISKKALADAFGVQPPSVQDWVKRGTIDKEKLPLLWRLFADVVGPEHWGLDRWIDHQHPSEGARTEGVVAHDLSHPKNQTSPIAATQVPVIGTLQMGAETMFELRSSPDGKPIGHVPAFAGQAGHYAVQVFGDELYPAVRHGACLVVDPDGPPIEGELVLLESTDGYYQVCELVALRGDTITLLPAAGGQRMTHPRSRYAAVHPVIDIAAGSRFRPSGQA